MFIEQNSLKLAAAILAVTKLLNSFKEYLKAALSKKQLST